jgi:hypothetical protein
MIGTYLIKLSVQRLLIMILNNTEEIKSKTLELIKLLDYITSKMDYINDPGGILTKEERIEYLIERFYDENSI